MLNQLARRRARTASRLIERPVESRGLARRRPLWLDFAIAGCAALAITAALVALTSGQRRERDRLAQVQETRKPAPTPLLAAEPRPADPRPADQRPPVAPRAPSATASAATRAGTTASLPAPAAAAQAQAPVAAPAPVTPPQAAAPTLPAVTPPLAAQVAAATSPSRLASLGSALPLRPEAAQTPAAAAFAPRDPLPENDGQTAPGSTPAESTAPIPPPRPMAALGDQVAQGTLGDGAPTDCLPDGLKTVLADVTKRFGAITVLATSQKQTSNHARGSARANLHFACRAVDFRPPDGQMDQVVQYVRLRPEVNGWNAYRNGVIHIDAAPPRSR